MIGPWLQRVDGYVRATVPFATALFAAMLDVLPLPGLGLESASTFSVLCAVYFWSLYRPDLFTPLAAFATGLVYDALAGLPLGLTSLLLLLVRSLMVTQRRFFLARSFPVVWACFVLLVPALMLVRWLFVSLWWTHAFAPGPLLFELAATVALYPLVSWVLARIHNQIPRLIHAP